MADEKNYQVTIRKNNVEFSVPRNNIVEVKQSHDGIVVNLQEGMYIYIIDTYMPVASKEKIIVTFNKFQNSDLMFDVSNYANPVRVTVR